MIRFLVVGCASMFGVVAGGIAIIDHFDPAGTNALDPVAMIASVTVAAIAWCFALHWMEQRKPFPTSARVIRRRDRVSRAMT